MTRPTLRRGAAFTAAAALLAGLAVGAPMAASGAPALDATDVAYIDTTAPSAAILKNALPDGTSATTLAPAGLSASFFAASTDTAAANSTVVTGYRSVATSAPQDSTAALVVTHGGVSKVLSAYTDVNPVVSADGQTVWFLVRGNLYSYDVTSGATTQINGAAEFNPWLAASGYHTYVYRLAISTDGTKAAELLQSYPDSGVGVNRSQIRVFDISTATPSVKKTPIWTSYNYAGGPAAKQLLPYNLVFTDPSTLVIGECIDYVCETWTTWSVDTTTAADGTAPIAAGTGIAALTNLNNLLGLKQSRGTWYAWALDLTVNHNITPYTTTDSSFAAPLTLGTPWPNGSEKYLHYVTPLADTPATFTSLSVRMGVAANLKLAKTLVATGTRVHYDAFGSYPVPLSGEVLQKEIAQVWRGQLQYSVNAGATWANVNVSTYGGGSTQKLTRNTWFRWSFPGDALTRPASTSAKLVSVVPSLSVKVTKSGASRTVAGVTSRSGGTVAMYKLSGRTWKKVVTTPVRAKGLYSFGKRTLSRGSYKVVTVADVSWASSTKTFSI
jgi:hypothetical protein